jgi:hypothetical protein
MAKSKQRTAARKKGAKRGKASVKPARKKTTKRATAKNAKSNMRRTTKRVTKPTVAEKPASVETRPIFSKPTAETTVVTAIEDPVHRAPIIEEPASVRAASEEKLVSA